MSGREDARTSTVAGAAAFEADRPWASGAEWLDTDPPSPDEW